MIKVGLIGIPILGLLLLIGIRLVRRGIAGTRTGTTLYCRNCGYDLSGRSADRCSECGSWIYPDNTVLGVWTLRVRPFVIGLMLMCVSVPSLVFYERWARTHIDLVPYAPDLALATFAEFGNRRSLRVLEQRVAADEISSWQAHLVAPLAFSNVRQPLELDDGWLNIISRLESKFDLCRNRQAKLFELASKVTTRHSDTARVADWYHYDVSVDSSLPGFRINWRIERIEFEISPKIELENQGGGDSRGGVQVGFIIPWMLPGKFLLKTTANVSVFKAQLLEERDSRPNEVAIWSTRQVIVEPIEVIWN